jgi:hypothetical protein
MPKKLCLEYREVKSFEGPVIRVFNTVHELDLCSLVWGEQGKGKKGELVSYNLFFINSVASS